MAVDLSSKNLMHSMNKDVKTGFLSRVAPDLILSNPAGAGFGIADPAGAGDGAECS